MQLYDPGGEKTLTVTSVFRIQRVNDFKHVKNATHNHMTPFFFSRRDEKTC